MPISTSVVGQRTPVVEHNIDARWIMAYAAALGDMNPRMLDTATYAPVIAHPVFPVCVEWPSVQATSTLPALSSLSADERARGVHAAHDLHIVRPICAGDVLRTSAEVVGLEARKPGAAQTFRIDTHDAAGHLVCTTWQLRITRSVAVDGSARWIAEPPALPTDAGTQPCALVIPLSVAAGAAHIYTECAHIWNPIHSDRAVALAAGLPDIILHGTATLALAVSAIVQRCLGGDIASVTRLGGRFTAMVPVPDLLQLEVYRQAADGVRFRVRNGAGQEAISQGFLLWR